VEFRLEEGGDAVYHRLALGAGASVADELRRRRLAAGVTRRLAGGKTKVGLVHHSFAHVIQCLALMFARLGKGREARTARTYVAEQLV